MSAHQERVRELLAIFAGREELPDIGQFTPQQRRRLKWAQAHSLLMSERRPWPGPLVGTCIKTWYVRTGF